MGILFFYMCFHLGGDIIENALSKVCSKIGIDRIDQANQTPELRSYNKTCISWLKSSDLIVILYLLILIS